MLLNDLLAHPQAQSIANRAFSRVKRLEYLKQISRTDPFSIVGDCNSESSILTFGVPRQRRSQRHFTALPYGVKAVRKQV
jgi:hypothetical protein